MKTLSRINRNWRQRGNLTKSGDVSIVNSRSSYNDDLEDEVISFSSSLPRFAKKQDNNLVSSGHVTLDLANRIDETIESLDGKK